ncbi:hypothetical protein BC830DRAFT_1157137 [Chytriomyces sp. MP71]|nr:hypothetical protein BC830DRAFT_1157137 [Chytriomyces sp. MP71]
MDDADAEGQHALLLSNYLFGVGVVQRRRVAFAVIQRDPILSAFYDSESGDYSYRSARRSTMAQIRRVAEFGDNEDKELLMRTMAECCNSFNMRLGVHAILFRTTINVFGSEAQRDEWIPKVDSFTVVGSFAMTELGHSSSLRDLETTATYDKMKDQFVLNSPTVTSTKWWIGMVGQTATHTVILAQTIVDGENAGLNWFILQLRDLKTGRMMPGVLVGDVGAKAGRDGLDNGWIKLTNARIPRIDMLMKMCTIDRDGNVDGPSHPALMYATLIPERLTLTFASKVTVGQAVSICFRQDWDHLGVSEKLSPARIAQLAPILAGVVVLHIAEKSVMQFWSHFEALGDDPSSDEYLSLLPDVHAMSAGLKAMITWWTSDVLSTCQQTAGISSRLGASFGSVSRLIGDWGVMTTGGGDNYALSEQCSRYLISNMKRVFAPQKKPLTFAGSVFYLNRAQDIIRFSAKSIPLKDSSKLLDWCIGYFELLTILLGKRLLSGVKDRKTFWNEHMIELNRLRFGMASTIVIIHVLLQLISFSCVCSGSVQSRSPISSTTINDTALFIDMRCPIWAGRNLQVIVGLCHGGRSVRQDRRAHIKISYH